MPRRMTFIVSLALVLLADCRSDRDGWVTHYPKLLDRQTAGVEGRPCEITETKDCDPFICHRGTCRVETCERERDCKHGGSCVEGYCALPPPQPGRRCQVFDKEAAISVVDAAENERSGVLDERVAKYLAQYQQCRCRPEYWAEGMTYSAADECGPFPCTPNGCSVQKCASDEECSAGVCASHTGWPDGWCVVSDDY